MFQAKGRTAELSPQSVSDFRVLSHSTLNVIRLRTVRSELFHAGRQKDGRSGAFRTLKVIQFFYRTFLRKEVLSSDFSSQESEVAGKSGQKRNTLLLLGT